MERKRKKLVIALIIMAVVIVGLVVAILVVAQPWKSGSQCEGGNTENSLTPEEVIRQKLDEMSAKVDEVTAVTSEMEYDAALEYVNNKIEEYAGTEFEFGMRMIKMYLLINNGEESLALEEADKIETETLYAEQQLDFYNVMIRASQGVGDEYMAQYYQDLYTTLYQYVYGEEGVND